MLVPSGPVGQSVPVALTDREKAILDFERSWWTEDGVKDALIEERFDLSSSRYYQLLNELLERPEALAYDPLVVRRLRRLRDRRRRARLDAAGASTVREGEA
jgi:SOS-response transcriptional repressor LexA